MTCSVVYQRSYFSSCESNPPNLLVAQRRQQKLLIFIGSSIKIPLNHKGHSNFCFGKTPSLILGREGFGDFNDDIHTAKLKQTMTGLLCPWNCFN
mmetsp:Transcript_2346/g.6291  ORF Transcript_2346/g.6291 Transcript_2346/m.6291 type:complete len:95 (-) Transcript_2346:51-335(-)